MRSWEEACTATGYPHRDRGDGTIGGSAQNVRLGCARRIDDCGLPIGVMGKDLGCDGEACAVADAEIAIDLDFKASVHGQLQRTGRARSDRNWMLGAYSSFVGTSSMLGKRSARALNTS